MQNGSFTFQTIAGVFGLAAALFLGPATSAHADPTTYAVSGDLTFNDCCGGQYVESITGSFTYDPAGSDAIDVTLTEVLGTGGQTLTWDEVALYNTSQNFFQSARFGDADVLYLYLGSDLTTVPLTETIASATIVCGYGCSSSSVSSTAEATSAPEPGSLVLFGTGLGLIAVAGRSRFWRAAAAARR